MNTIRLTNEYDVAVDLLRSGELVAVPTETVYGLAGNGLDISAVEKIYAVKGRPAVKPLSLMVPGTDSFSICCEDVPHAAYVLADHFWPGPVTIVMKASERVPGIVRAGGRSVGLRCPDHSATLSILKLVGVPLAAPSANVSDAPSPKTADDVLAYFDGKIAAVVDGGRCNIGTESTIVDLSQTPYTVLRKGALSEERLWDALLDDMKIIGLTGGTGCGKTTALQVMESLGAEIIDCDAVYHSLLLGSESMQQEIQDRFGDVFVNGCMDRKKLGEIVFHDSKALDDLNAITHRFVTEEVVRQLRMCVRNGKRLAAIDAIALIESGISEMCDTIFAVTAPREDRIARIMERDGISADYAASRVDAQKSDAWYTERCDYILENTGTMEEFEALCRKKILEVIA